jgi:deazaflavin-dependent oxidoreductase (nitroreductase family)
VHRAIYRFTRGRVGLWTPGGKRGWGTLRLTTVGRRSGSDRTVLLGYLEDGHDLVVLAMNGWGEGEPAWWLNLQSQPAATVQLPGRSPYRISASAAEGPERDRLWELWRRVEPDLDQYAALRSTPTAVVVLAPTSD